MTGQDWSRALDRTIEVQELTTTIDDYGGVVEAWQTVSVENAQYLPGGGNERFAAAQVYAQTEGRFRLRYRPWITPEHRICWEGRAYDIVAVEEIGRRVGSEVRVK